MLGSFNTVLMANEKDEKVKSELIKETDNYFEKALALGPKHQEILSEWAKSCIAYGDYKKMKGLSEKCVSVNPETNSCYWYLGLSKIFLGDKEQGQKDIEIAKEKRYPYDAQYSLSQLAIAYTIDKDNKELISVYNSLIEIAPKIIQYRATLAVIYKQSGNYAKARETALEILKMAPEMKDKVDEFLQTLY
jgi:tetratricopeptide (TPR) repeat protein